MVPRHVQRKMGLPERKNKRHRAQVRLFSFFAGCDSQSERLMLWIVKWWGCWCCSPLIHPRNGRSAVRINTRPLFPRRALAQSKWFIYKRLAAVRAPAPLSRGRFQVYAGFWRAPLSKVLISRRDVSSTCQRDAAGNINELYGSDLLCRTSWTLQLKIEAYFRRLNHIFKLRQLYILPIKNVMFCIKGFTHITTHSWL